MKIYLLSQRENFDYDTYDSCVVIAENEEKAIMTHPYEDKWDGIAEIYDGWCSSKYVKVKYLGETDLEPQVVCASYNAGY